nr:unnamed protein product [Spirometra erinaceieuropaei]
MSRIELAEVAKHGEVALAKIVNVSAPKLRTNSATRLDIGEPIPPDLARDVLRKRLEEKYDETTRPLMIQHLIQLFAFCQRTFSTFDGRTYEQNKGTPMGSPISSLVAELVLQELEKVAFSHYKPAFWRRYVDGHLCTVIRDHYQLVAAVTEMSDNLVGKLALEL